MGALSGPDGASLLPAINAGGASFRGVVLTRNARVMVSLGEGGRVVRLNERFAGAPPEVLAAVGALYGSARPSRRRAARERVREFLRAAGPVETPPPPGHRPVPARDREPVRRMGEEFDRVNAEHFGGSLPRIHIALSGRMRRRHGHFSTHPVEIVLSRRLFTSAPAGEAEHTLRHEMIHLWQHVTGARLGHGADFRRWAARLDVHPRARRSVSWLSR